MSSPGVLPRSTPVIVEGTNVTPIPDGRSLVPASHSPPAASVSEEPPPPPLETGDELWALPPGWTTARHVEDGRIYYAEMSTGRTSWVHPMSDAANAAREVEREDWNSANQGRKKWRGIAAFMNPRKTKGREGNFTGTLDTPLNATRRPDSHQCWAFLALVLFFPIGLFAMYHSFRVDKMWEEGRYGDAANHSREASKYGTLGVVIGSIIILLFLLSRREEKWEWPDFNFDGFD